MKIYEYTCPELASELSRRFGRGRFHAGALFRGMYRDLAADPLSAPELHQSTELSANLRKTVTAAPGTVTQALEKDNVVKFLTRLADGSEIESVILPMAAHHTVCLSTQAGCRMGCRFCETGRQGFLRNLTVEEMIGQVVHARRTRGSRVRNVVFMGMGEPLDNFDNVLQAVRVLNDQQGLNIALRRITISTAGLADKIRLLADVDLPGLHLFVSINAPNDRLRSDLMPINRSFPLAEVKQSLHAFGLPKSGRHMIGYVLIPGVNDANEHAEQLADYVRDLPAKINLIPYNPSHGDRVAKPEEKSIQDFMAALRQKNVVVIRRGTLGSQFQAACGQLRGKRNPEPDS
jgi:23S rRNA (adenine2503-C2)-methyltransferase